MTFEDDLAKLFTEKTKKIRYGNIIISILNRNSKSVGLMFKNLDNPDYHLSLYFNQGNPQLHYTYEKAKSRSEKYQWIDIQEFQGKLARWFHEVFSNAEKVELNDPRFTGMNVRFISKVNLQVTDSNKKEITIGDNYETTLKKFENINEIQEDAIGVIINEDGKEKELLFLKSGDVYKLDLSNIE